MANNRMYLRCRQCGKTLLLGKIFCGNYYCFYENMEDCLDKFYIKHAFCGDSAEGYTKYVEPEFAPPKDRVHYENQFELAYEHLRETEDKNVYSKNTNEATKS